MMQLVYKKLPLILLIILAAIMGTAIAAYRAFFNPTHNTSSQLSGQIKAIELPATYNKIKIGMNENKVLSTIGIPTKKGTNPKFTHKKQDEWLALQQEADKLSLAESNSNSSVNMQLVKINAELSHRIKDIWTYQPNSEVYMVLSFSEEGILLNIGTGFINHRLHKS